MTNLLFLPAKDREKVLPGHAPVTISPATDRFQLIDGKWPCTYRRLERLFETGTPLTHPRSG